MFGPRTVGTSATVKPSRSVEMAAPALSVPVTAAEQNAQGPAATAEKPEAATAMFQMFGPPNVAHVHRPTSSAPSNANALQPAAPASGNVPTLAPPAAHALLNMFGTFDTQAANAFGVNAAAANDPQPVSGARPTSPAPQARVTLNMFGSSAAPPETISASGAGGEQVLPAMQTAVVRRGAPLDMFTSSAVSPPAAADFVPRAHQGPTRDDTSAAEQRPTLFHMFGSSDGQAAAARPPLINAAVANDAYRSAAPPTRPLFNMFGSSNAQPTPVPSALPVANPPALPVSVGPNETIKTKNAEQASPPPVLYGAPALGVFDIFGTRAGTATPATHGKSPARASGVTHAAAPQRFSFFKMFDKGNAAILSTPTQVTGPSVSELYGTHICPSSSLPSAEQLDAVGISIPAPSAALSENAPPPKAMSRPPATGGQVGAPCLHLSPLANLAFLEILSPSEHRPRQCVWFIPDFT